MAYYDSVLARTRLSRVHDWPGRGLDDGLGQRSSHGREAMGPFCQALDRATSPTQAQRRPSCAATPTWFDWDWDAADREFRQAWPWPA
jgi:hypothetical protein